MTSDHATEHHHPTTSEGLRSMTEFPTEHVTAQHHNSSGAELTITPTATGKSWIRVETVPGRALTYICQDRIQALDIALQLLEADLDNAPDREQDGRDMAASMLRGYLEDVRDSRDDHRVAAFYEGQHAAEERPVTVAYGALPLEDKRAWRRKYQAACKSITTTPSTREG